MHINIFFYKPSIENRTNARAGKMMTGFSVSFMMDAFFIDTTFSIFCKMITRFSSIFNNGDIPSLILLVNNIKNRTTYFLSTTRTIIHSYFESVNWYFPIIFMNDVCTHFFIIIGKYMLSKLVFLFFSLYSHYSLFLGEK